MQPAGWTGTEEFARGALALLEVDELSGLLDAALALVVRRAQPREAFIELLLEDEGGEDAPRVVAHGCSSDRLEEIKRVVSSGIIAEATATGRTVQTANAQLDPRFFQLESVQRNEIEAVLCVPIGKDVPRGVIYLQGKSEGGAFAFPADARADVELVARTLSLTVDRLVGESLAPKRPAVAADDPFAGVIGMSTALREVVEKLRFAAPLDVHVLLTGPSGAGKTQLAHAVHAASRRRTGPFVELNCAAVPEALLENELFGSDPGAHSTAPRQGAKGKVEMADGGTLFLDEIGDLPLLAQAKILQLLQSKTYYRLGGSVARQADVRIMAATNVQLKRAISEKRFREDLYFRLKVLEVRVPSLAERPEDVVPLARHFLRQALARHDFSHKMLSPGAVRAIQATEWNGNVRELAHQIEAGALAAEQRGSDRVEKSDLFPDAGTDADATGPRSLHQATREFQRKHIASVLTAVDWNMTDAARVLDISRAHLYTLVRNLALKPED